LVNWFERIQDECDGELQSKSGCCLLCADSKHGCLCYNCKCKKCECYVLDISGGHCEISEGYKRFNRLKYRKFKKKEYCLPQTKLSGEHLFE